MTQAFNKIVRIGTAKTFRGASYSIYCKIQYTAEGRLTISGVEGPRSSGNATGGCGQINHGLSKKVSSIKPAPGWSHKLIREFFEVWEKFHLNDMKAGTPEQEEFLETIKDQFPGYPTTHYTWACDRLKEADLNPAPNGYQYGSKWLRTEVPVEALDWLKALPDTDKQPAWV